MQKKYNVVIEYVYKISNYVHNLIFTKIHVKVINN